MKMRNLLKVRRAIKNVNSAKKLVDEIQKEIAINDRNYQERDKELKDLLKIISASQEIIGSTDK
jgi:hypothetical protein